MTADDDERRARERRAGRLAERVSRLLSGATDAPARTPREFTDEAALGERREGETPDEAPPRDAPRQP